MAGKNLRVCSEEPAAQRMFSQKRLQCKVAIFAFWVYYIYAYTSSQQLYITGLGAIHELRILFKFIFNPQI